MTVYRISDCRYISDLSGKGAAMYGGRWNSRDVYMLYTAQSPSLALLESVVHFGRLPPKNYCMATIAIPDSIAPAITPHSLPENWYTCPAPDFLKAIGDEFIKSGEHLALPVPSVVMTDECNYLINPRHELFCKMKIVVEKPVRLDERIFKAIA
jgi:RES domain-containing protein